MSPASNRTAVCLKATIAWSSDPAVPFTSMVLSDSRWSSASMAKPPSAWRSLSGATWTFCLDWIVSLVISAAFLTRYRRQWAVEPAA